MAEPVSSAKIVVLDDDPTGTQTVHDIPVLTQWDVPSLTAELSSPGPAFYILTNSRAFPPDRAMQINREVGTNLREAANRCQRPFRVVSRSDSTLRGHYPAETDALATALGGNFDATLIIPAFFEGGRTTVDDVHYVADGDRKIPAGETEFARDALFGYRVSNLRAWVEEKTSGRIRAENVVSFSLTDLRGDVATLGEKLAALTGDRVAIVNAERPADLLALVRGLAIAEAAGRRFLFRTAASFVAAYAGIAPRSLLRAEEIAPPGLGGGLVVIGSHVGKTSRQLEVLREQTGIPTVEVAVEKLLRPEERASTVTAATRLAASILESGGNVVVFTSRPLIRGGSGAENALISESVSRGLVEIVTGLSRRPRWLIAKGGITSSDIATKALGVKRALTLGQALPGVPVWKLGAEARWPGLAYVVFPGNVGGPDALAALVTSLSANQRLP